MDSDRVITAMAYRSPDEEWAERTASTLDASFALVLDAPEQEHASPPAYADKTLVSRSRLGFSGARRVSMLIASEFGSDCLVVDGDGQHPPEALERIFDCLAATDADIVIPQRRNRRTWVDRDGTRYDRTPLERLETHCAFAAAGVDSVPQISKFDAQPGAFGFRSAVVSDLLPSDTGWLADWEITVSALERGSYETVDITTEPDAQEETNFTWDQQRQKIADIDERLRARGHAGIQTVFDRHRDEFDSDERLLITDALAEVKSVDE